MGACPASKPPCILNANEFVISMGLMADVPQRWIVETCARVEPLSTFERLSQSFGNRRCGHPDACTGGCPFFHTQRSSVLGGTECEFLRRLSEREVSLLGSLG